MSYTDSKCTQNLSKYQLKSTFLNIFLYSPWKYKYLHELQLINIKFNAIKFFRALLITNQRFGMIHQSHFSILLIIF